MRKGRSTVFFTRSLSGVLGLPRTAERILDSLARAQRYLSVREVVRRVRMSERSVRKYLLMLVRRGLLHRRVVTGGSRRVAYEYSLRSSKAMFVAARQDMLYSLRGLEKAMRGLGRGRVKKTSPRSASSSHS